jgi:hypothetical protein
MNHPFDIRVTMDSVLSATPGPLTRCATSWSLPVLLRDRRDDTLGGSALSLAEVIPIRNLLVSEFVNGFADNSCSGGTANTLAVLQGGP